jgi:hypothetical protein
MTSPKQDRGPVEHENPFWQEQEALFKPGVLDKLAEKFSTRPRTLRWWQSLSVGLFIGSLFLSIPVSTVVVLLLAAPIAALRGQPIEVVEGPLMPITFPVWFIVLALLVRRKHRRKLLELKWEEARQLRELEQEAEALVESSNGIARRLPQTLQRASETARRAEKEYRENAFAPFGDAVEQVARDLDSFNQDAQRLSQNAQKYRVTIRNRQGKFPVFNLASDTLPNPAPVLAELQRIVRMGQTNFQFATIWEQRKTREVLIAGFRTLGEAIDNLGSTIERSMSDLSANVANLVEEQIRTREAIERQTREHGEMLDNIQRHRKPTL